MMNDCSSSSTNFPARDRVHNGNNLVDSPHRTSNFPIARTSSSLPVTRRSSTHKKEWFDTNLAHGAGFASDLEALLSGSYHHCFDSDSDDDTKEGMKTLPNRYVSQEELDALKGCVTKRRILFSPGPAASLSSITTSCRELGDHQSAGHSYSVPLIRKHIVTESDGSHSRQGSLEYDHLSDFNPHQHESNPTHCSNTSTPGDTAVSIQFRLHNEKTSKTSSTPPSLARYIHSDMKYKSPVSSSISEIHRHEHCHVSAVSLGRSNSSCVPLVQSRYGDCCYDPTARPTPMDSWQIGKAPTGSFNVSETPITTPTRAVQHQSPYHTKFNSPLLSKHQYMHDEGSTSLLREDHTGSNFSIYSQSTTVSSINDRPHCSYSKGVDISVFKDRTNVSYSVLECGRTFFLRCVTVSNRPHIILRCRCSALIMRCCRSLSGFW